MSALNTLKTACLKKPFASFKDLSPGDYIVNHFTFVETKHGKRVRIDLDNTYMYLPERFAASLSEAAMENLNQSSKVMTYSGKDAADQNRLILDFNDIDTFAQTLYFESLAPSKM